jgi:hypothetical protein
LLILDVTGWSARLERSPFATTTTTILNTPNRNTQMGLVSQHHIGRLSAKGSAVLLREANHCNGVIQSCAGKSLPVSRGRPDRKKKKTPTRRRGFG